MQRFAQNALKNAPNTPTWTIAKNARKHAVNVRRRVNLILNYDDNGAICVNYDFERLETYKLQRKIRININRDAEQMVSWDNTETGMYSCTHALWLSCIKKLLGKHSIFEKLQNIANRADN